MPTIAVKPVGAGTNELLGAGALYIGGSIDAWSTTPGTLLGTTKGGCSFTDNAEFRDREADGDYVPMKGAKDLIKIRPQLTINLLEVSTAILEDIYGGMATTSGTNFDQVTRKFDLSSSYQDVIYWIGARRDGKNIAIELKNVIGNGPLIWNPTKDEEVIQNIVLEAHGDPATFDITDVSTYPYNIWVEKAA